MIGTEGKRVGEDTNRGEGIEIDKKEKEVEHE